MNDDGATEYMTQDPGGLEDYDPAPARQRMEGAGGNHQPIVEHGTLCLLVDQGVGNSKLPTHELALESVAYLLNRGQHKLFSMKRLAKSFDAPMRFYPAAAVIRPRSRRKPLMLRFLRPGNGFRISWFTVASPRVI